PVMSTPAPGISDRIAERVSADAISIDRTLIEDRTVLIPAATPAMPRQTLLHGSIFGITLTADPERAPGTDAIEVAVGPTGFSALSALLADGTDEERASSERVLAAFSSG